MKNPSKNIIELLENSTLSHIVQRANALNELNQKIQHCLPEQYKMFYRILNLVDNELIFEVQNGTVLHGLQLQQGHLLSLIQQVFPQVVQLKFKVNPNFKHY